ncbi:LD-carboxypeptidase [Candidatus Daviesbacteria bacterium]|nr:LD-carboxypeptidase [Candidatus Daviesbacteria bacterium]
MKILKPAKLNIGDTIGIVASSLPVLPSFKENYERGKKILNDLGFKIYEGKTIGKVKWWAAGTPKEVAEDINVMFANKSIKAIMTQTGGYSALTVLEHLDYKLIAKNIKPYIGMSDVTNFHMAFFTKCHMLGFHMDDVTFGLGHPWAEGEEHLGEFDKQVFLNFLTKAEAPGVVGPLTEWEEWKKGKTSGRLIGGNLHLLVNLIGTEYFPSLKAFEGAILFWEEVGEPLHNIGRYLTQLKYAGVLDKISGMLIGKITYIKEPREKEVIPPTVKELIMEVLKEYKFPIMANLDFGHFTVNIPMPIGIKVSFDTSKNELNFLESAVV